ncbi:OB-fold nucleic acid binding domain-containing protein [Thermosynechococcaceae cyanobacterium Okahandja]
MRPYLKFAVAVAIAATGVNAAPIPSTAQSVTPIGNLRAFQGITIQGTIRSVVGNKFILDDGTGQVIVDAGPSWYHQLNLREGETVTVVGKQGRHDFDAFQITRANGEVTQIRPSMGPPPWSGRYQRQQPQTVR